MIHVTGVTLTLSTWWGVGVRVRVTVRVRVRVRVSVRVKVGLGPGLGLGSGLGSSTWWRRLMETSGQCATSGQIASVAASSSGPLYA